MWQDGNNEFRDINSYTKVKTTLEPTNVFRGHTSVVGVRDLFSYILVGPLIVG